MVEQISMGILIGLMLGGLGCMAIKGAFSLVWYCQTHDNLVTESIRFVGAIIALTLFMGFVYAVR